jgi:hypothetical protein
MQFFDSGDALLGLFAVLFATPLGWFPLSAATIWPPFHRLMRRMISTPDLPTLTWETLERPTENDRRRAMRTEEQQYALERRSCS